MNVMKPRQFLRSSKVIGMLLVLFFAHAVCAEPTVTSSINYYDIYPASAKDIGTEMRKKSPIETDGITFNGNTKWYVKWHFKWKRRNGICRISQVSTSLDVKYTMPRIPASHAVDKKVRSSFNGYYKALMKHEEEHKNSGLYAARDIEAALMKLEEDTDCDRLSKSANLLGNKIIKTYNKRDEDYDKRTKNGKLEGVDIKNFI